MLVRRIVCYVYPLPVSMLVGAWINGSELCGAISHHFVFKTNPLNMCAELKMKRYQIDQCREQ